VIGVADVLGIDVPRTRAIDAAVRLKAKLRDHARDAVAAS
jgi:hypothetical protein